MSFDNLNSALDKMAPYNGVYFMGKVVDAEDPLNLNRVRVKIIGLYEGVNDAIPWAIPIKTGAIGQSGSTGVFGSPHIGSEVIVILQQGNPQYPLYMSIQTVGDAEFPNGTWGWKDKYENKFIVNAEGMTWSSKCGFRFHVDKDCKVTLDAPGGFEINGDTQINGTLGVTGDTTLDANLSVGGNTDIGGNTTVGGNVTATGDIQGAGKSLAGHIHLVLSRDFGVTSPPL